MKKIVIILLSVFLLMCCAFGLAACGGGGDDSGDNPNTEQPNNPDDGDNDNKPTTPEEPKEELTPSDIYKKVNPSVVFILIDNLQGIASGTGFFIDDEGTIVTNYHVIEDGTAGVIQLSDGTQAAIGNVLGYDENLDIAILETTATNTTPVEIGNSSLVEVGDTVYAIGYPAATTIGFSSSTFTTSMVSMNRSIGGYNYIQSTVDITHGNSGGTLINTYGEVIGITTAGLNVGDVDYMNLSIPIQRVDTVALDDNESLLIVTKRHYPVYARFYNGSSLFTTQTLKYEQTATVPSSSPSKTGYTFAGWYADSGLTTPFDFSTKILEDTRIYAKFDINTYTVTYNLNSGKWNGTTPDSTWTVNNSGTALPVPKRSGYLFEGWTDSSGNFVDKLPASSNLGNVTYNAHWIEGAEGLTIKNGTVTDYNGQTANIVIPSSFQNITVTGFSNSAFAGCTELKSIIIPDSVKSIGNSSFKDCNNLTSVTIGNGVTTIGFSAFNGCSKLTSVTIGEGVTKIGRSAFYNCTALTEIYYNAIEVDGFTDPNNLDCDNVFYNAGKSTSGVSVFFGDAVTIIPANLFNIYDSSAYPNITSVYIGKNVTSIYRSAFARCTELKSIVIPDSVTGIGSFAFSGCNKLENVYITNLTAWCNISFSGYSMESNPLCYADNLYINGIMTKELTIPDDVTIIKDFAFSGYTNLISVKISNHVTSIGSNAFSGCTGLTNITIGRSVTSIKSSAFKDCTGLTSIVIPENVTDISGYAFEGCSNLKSALFEETTGWTCKGMHTEAVKLSSSSLENSTTAARFLTTTYNFYNWKRS